MTAAVETPTRTGNLVASVLRNRNFRWLWIGQGTSLLGDQFSMIAMPWLVLQLSHDPMALGTVMALDGLPQAVLALVGGAFTDRFSSRTIMLWSDVVRLCLTTLLAILTFTGTIQLWMLYGFALLYGIVAGMFYPASGAMIPLLVERDRLQAANSVWQGTMQLTLLVGPALAGGLIAVFGSASANGIALAFTVDALTFLVSVITLWLLVVPRLDQHAEPDANVLAAIKAGLSFAWRDPLLRLLFTVLIANNLILSGTWSVGIPVLADLRLSGGAAAFGLIWAAFAGGNLLGILFSGVVRRLLRPSDAGILTIAISGIGTLALGLTGDTWLACLIMFANGIGGGYINVVIMTLLHRRTPQAFLGRIMSLLYFSSVGLGPISKALAGGIVTSSLVGLFGGAGILLLLLAIWIPLQPAVRLMDTEAEQFAG